MDKQKELNEIITIIQKQGDKGLKAIQDLINNGAEVNARDKDDNILLDLALKNNNPEVAKLLIDNGANVNITKNLRESSLHWAVEKGYKEVVQLLINKDASLEYRCWGSQTPLHIAALKGNKEIVKLLIKKGADVNAKNQHGETALDLANKLNNTNVKELLELLTDNQYPLHKAAWYGKIDSNGKIEVAKLLTANPNIKIDEKYKNDRTALHYAVEEGNIEVVKELIKHGADANITDSEVNTPLDLATENDQIKKLLQSKIKDKNGRTALHEAVENNDENKVKELIENVTNVNAQNNDGWTPLHIATEKGHTAVVQLLIDNGADVNIQYKYGSSPLHVAAEKGNIEVVKFLIEHGADINAKNKHTSVTPLHEAAWNGHEAVAQLLIAKGADVNAKTKNGATPLHWAAVRGHEAVVSTLFNNGAQNQHGSTALHEAVKNNDENKIKILIKKNAKIINAKDKNGKTALHHYTILYDNKEIVQFLIDNGADVNIPDNKEQIALHYTKNKEIAELLQLNIKRAKVDEKNEYGRTALHEAIINEDKNEVKDLIEKGANVNVQDKDGRTALDLAILYDNEEIIQFLNFKKEKKDDHSQYHQKQTNQEEPPKLDDSSNQPNISQQTKSNQPLSIVIPSTSKQEQGQKAKQTTSKQHPTFKNQLAQLQSFENLSIQSKISNKKDETKKDLSFKQTQNNQLDQLQNWKALNQQIKEKTKIPTPNPIGKEERKVSIKTFVNNLDSNKTTKKVLHQSLIS